MIASMLTTFSMLLISSDAFPGHQGMALSRILPFDPKQGYEGAEDILCQSYKYLVPEPFSDDRNTRDGGRHPNPAQCSKTQGLSERNRAEQE